nr:hypothetical protein [Mesorhizobium onobrychidis]
MRLLFNILAISGSAMFAGVMLTIGVTLGGYWKSLPAAEFLDWFSQNDRFIIRTIPLVVVPTLIGLIGSLWLGWSEAREEYVHCGSGRSPVSLPFWFSLWPGSFRPTRNSPPSRFSWIRCPPG